MSNSHRLLFAALIGIIAFIALGVGPFTSAIYASHYTQDTVGGNRQTNDAGQNPSQIYRDRAGLPYVAERITSGPEPQNSQERERRDLAAQESMSVWAFWLLAVSVFGLLVTSAGTGLLLWQIMLTRKAVEETSQATLAMNHGNEISRAAARLQFAPYVFFDRADIRRISPGKFIVDVIAKNFGQTPAVITVGEATRLVEFPIARGVYFPAGGLSRNDCAIGPGQEIVIEANLTESHWPDGWVTVCHETDKCVLVSVLLAYEIRFANGDNEQVYREEYFIVQAAEINQGRARRLKEDDYGWKPQP